MFAGLEELSRTASTITFGKQTFHLNIYVVQVEDEVECFSLQVAVLPSPETHFNGHVNLVGCEADISGGRPQVQVGGDGAVQFVHTAGVQRRQVETKSPGSAGRKYLAVLHWDLLLSVSLYLASRSISENLTLFSWKPFNTTSVSSTVASKNVKSICGTRRGSMGFRPRWGSPVSMYFVNSSMTLKFEVFKSVYGNTKYLLFGTTVWTISLIKTLQQNSAWVKVV